ncbi:hypothetical protein EBU94_05525 [bacterium]|nr:hypothetical protein [bacterium]
MITLVVRKSKNYDVGKRANFYDQHSVGFWSIHKKIELWNNTFSMPYFEVRKKLSQIAFCNIEKIGFDSVFDCVEDFCNSKEKNNSEWIVPIDDDDWPHPQLVQKLKNEKIDDKICHWSTVKSREK